MPRTIHVLPDHVANQIAAGEVVERPASVVKELVENALDAGATRVEIRIESGGKRKIRVADDGHGMGREDAILALDRHATSKIRGADDLRGVRSFGFRGEALPSIGSVSRFMLETRPRAEESGTRVSMRGGAISSVEEVARTPGTTVTVDSLFFNAPARGKFLRNPATETRGVSDALAPLALAHPQVGFELYSDERALWEMPPAKDLVERVVQLFGEEAGETLVSVDFEGDGMSVRGVIQRPDAARPGFRRAFLFADGRPFREAALLKAADRGYRTTIPEGHRPWLFLFLEVPKGSVDVNVHPTKAEVRFRDRGAVERIVEAAVRRALEGESSAATLDAHPARPRMEVREPGSLHAPFRGGAGREGQGSARNPPPEPQMGLFMGAADPASPPAADPGDPQDLPVDTASMGRTRLWQVHNAWIMAEVRDGLLLIDQHAAHERVLFEEIMAGFQEGVEGSQRLLFPLTIRLTAAEFAVVEDLKGLLYRAGFEVDGFGSDTVIVHAVPNPHPYFDAERCFREMIEELTLGSELTRSARNQHERLAMSFACKAAIKAGQPLDDREIHELFDRLFATELPYHDVHGRPTTVRLSRGELERKFGR